MIFAVFAVFAVPAVVDALNQIFRLLPATILNS
jgi:hypothetical protein